MLESDLLLPSGVVPRFNNLVHGIYWEIMVHIINHCPNVKDMSSPLLQGVHQPRAMLAMPASCSTIFPLG